MSPKSKLPLGGISATKSIAKQLTFYSRGGKQKVRAYHKPSGDPSAAQITQRQIIKLRVQEWQALSFEEKDSWNIQAKILGDPWSGYTLFMSTQEAVMKFTELEDTFPNYSGLGGKPVYVNGAENGLEAILPNILTMTNAERIALGGISVGRIVLCTDTEKTWIGTGSGDTELLSGSFPAADVEFLDNFNDSSRFWTWKDQTPTGTINETGTYLEISASAAEDANWWGAGLVTNPRAFIGELRSPQEIITKLIYHTTNLSSQGGMFVSNDPTNGGNDGYFLARQDDGEIIVAKLGTGNIGDSGGVVNLPVWLRIRMTGNGKGNTTYFHYSINGTDWISLASVNDLSHRGVGLAVKNWANPGPEIIARFDHFSVTMSPGPS